MEAVRKRAEEIFRDHRAQVQQVRRYAAAGVALPLRGRGEQTPASN
jgi:hypothetical protein